MHVRAMRDDAPIIEISLLPEDPPWTVPLDPTGRVVLAAVELEGMWTFYLALDGAPLDFDIQATAGSDALN